VVVKDKVYDVTSFIDEHPGGAKLIASRAGKDVTEEFEMSHPDSAWEILEKFQVGVLDENAELPASGERFSTFELTEKSQESQDTFRMTFTIMSGSVSAHKWLPGTVKVVSKIVRKSLKRNAALATLALWADRPIVGQHVMIKASVGDETVVRNYTPVSQTATSLTFVIKVYRPTDDFPEGGKMSQILESMELGGKLLISNPQGEIEYHIPGGQMISSGMNVRLPYVGFICGGSGITPAYQILATALRDPLDKRKFVLLYANRTVNDILLRKELEELAAAYPKRFSLHFTVTTAPEDEEWEHHTGLISFEMIKEIFPPGEDDKCFVAMCGPPGMINQACIPNLKKYAYASHRLATF